MVKRVFAMIFSAIVALHNHLRARRGRLPGLHKIKHPFFILIDVN